jgi:hypothetical protein
MFKRGKGVYNSDYKIDDFYEWYIATVSDPLPKHLFRNIFRGYMEQIMVDVIYNSGEFNMGHKLGSVRVREKDYKVQLDEHGNVDKGKLVPDWGKTLKKWKKLYPDVDPSDYKNIENKPIVYLMNEHSDETLKQWFWDKATCNIAGQSAYKFNATRYWDRLLAKVNKESNITYFR